MTNAFVSTLFEIGVQSAVFAAIVMAVLFLAGDRLRPKWRYLLCLLVLIRLALPVLPGSPFGVLPRAHDLLLSMVTSHNTNAQTLETPQNSPDVMPQSVAPPGGESRHAIPHRPDRSERSAFDASQETQNILPPPTPDVQPPIRATGELHEAIVVADVPASDAAIRGRLTFAIFVVWLCGAVFFGLKYASGAIWLLRNGRRWRDVDDAETLSLLDACRREIGLRRRVRCRLTDDFASAASFGILRPVVLLPATTFRELPPMQKRLLLLHELTHIQRFDPAVQLFAMLLTLFHWANPILWLVRRRLEHERESACDAAVLHKLERENHHAYGLMVLAFAGAHVRKHSPAAMVGISPHRGLKRRIEMIVKHQPATWRQPVFGLTLLIALTLTGLTGAKSKPGISEPAEPVATQNNADENDLQTQKDFGIFETDDRIIVRGQVLNADQTPAAFARVWVPFLPNEAAVSADENGRFQYEITKAYFARFHTHYDFLAISQDGESLGMRNVAFSKPEKANGDWFREPDLAITLDLPCHVITGTVVDADGNPVADATVGGCWTFCQHSFPTRTKADGSFRFLYPQHMPLQFVYAAKKGVGMMYVTTNDPPKRGSILFGPPGAATHGIKQSEFQLTLRPFTSRTIRIVNEDDEPLAGCRISPWKLRNGEADHDFDALHCEFDFSVMTNEDGMAVLDTVPKGWAPQRMKGLLITPPAEGNVSPKDGKRYYYTMSDMAVMEDFGHYYKVDRDQEKNLWTITLAKGVRFDVTVYRPDGSPAAWDEIQMGYSTLFGSSEQNFILDSEGRITFLFPWMFKEHEKNLREAFKETWQKSGIRFQIWNENGVAPLVQDCDFADGTGVRQVELHMRQSVGVSGKVHHNPLKNMPYPDIYVWAREASDEQGTDMQYRLLRHHSFRYDRATKRFEGELLPGEYLIEARVYYHHPDNVDENGFQEVMAQMTAEQRITVVEGQPLEIDLTAE